MSEFEFKVEPKKAKLTVGGKTFEGRFPYHGEKKELMKVLDSAKPEEAVKLYEKFFLELGFPIEALDNLDGKDFMDFMLFLIGGGFKKNSK